MDQMYHTDIQYRCNDDSFFSLSSTEQRRVEDDVAKKFKLFKDLVAVDPELPKLNRDAVVDYLRKGLKAPLAKNYQSLDASRPWLCFWILHSLELLDEPITDEIGHLIVQFLKTCRTSEGGYGGGPGQIAHLATTYAAIMALSIVGTDSAWDSIDRHSILSFLQARKQANGSFVMHNDGEVDIRAAYCAATVACILNIPMNPLFDSTPQWLAACQTYEGGFSAEPGAEAHGGYTFCGIATLTLLGHERLCYMESLMRWLAWKQMRYEGGYQGRTNKLVDGCYSFWQAASWPVINQILSKQSDAAKSASSNVHAAANGDSSIEQSCMFDPVPLQNYILTCCQNPHGGFTDRPGNNRDYYHTCYTLSGLALAQQTSVGESGGTIIVGSPDNALGRNHPIFNICDTTEAKARKYWAAKPM